MHKVVEYGGILDVAPVKLHDRLELLGPRLASELQVLQLQMGLGDHAPHEPVELYEEKSGIFNEVFDLFRAE